MTCPACQRNEEASRGAYRFAIARTATGFVNLSESQYHVGYCQFVSARHVEELHQLDPPERELHLREMAAVEEAVWKAFSPSINKMNVEYLGNVVSHLHWHLIPRHIDDPFPDQPAWLDEAFILSLKEKPLLHDSVVEDRKRRVLEALKTTGIEIAEAFS